MIQAVAFCPYPPVLVPALAGSAAREVGDLLAACDSAIAALLAERIRIVVLGGADRTGRVEPNAPAGFGRFGGMPSDRLDAVSFAEAAPLPLSLAVGRWLVSRAQPSSHSPVELWGIAPDGPPPDLGPAPYVLLVMGDGAARRGVKAPGYLDERAAAYDGQVEAALRSGDAGGLAGLDAALGAELLAAGTPAWRAAGRLLADEQWRGNLTFSADPFGVQYFVATWTRST